MCVSSKIVQMRRGAPALMADGVNCPSDLPHTVFCAAAGAMALAPTKPQGLYFLNRSTKIVVSVAVTSEN